MAAIFGAMLGALLGLILAEVSGWDAGWCAGVLGFVGFVLGCVDMFFDDGIDPSESAGT